MRCIFCRNDSTNSRSIEHIVPESLGNTEHTLPRGAVCDGCNQYFARKLERPVLETPTFTNLRAAMNVQSKRGRIPEMVNGDSRPAYRLMSRFLAKVGLEALAFKVIGVSGWNDEIVDNRALDEIRTYSRYGVGADWPFTVRTLHPVNAQFSEAGDVFEVLHEFGVLYTTCSEAYACISLFGVEFTLNLGGRELDGFREWLEQSDFASPLYPHQNRKSSTLEGKCSMV